MSDSLAKITSSPPSGGKGVFSVVSALAPVITSIADNILYDRRQQQQFAREDMYWQRNADYNTASSQVARLKDAGLSANLAYGSVDSGNITSMPNSVSPRGANIDPMTLANIQNINAQTRNIEVDTAKKREEIPVVQATADKIVSETGVNDVLADKFATEIYKIEQDTEKIRQTTELIKEQKNTEKERRFKLELENQLFDQTFDTQVKEIGLQYKISYYEVKYLAETLASRIYGVDVDNKMKESQKNLNEELVKFYNSMASYYGFLAQNMGFQIDAKLETDKKGRSAYQAESDIVRFQGRNMFQTTYFPMMLQILNMYNQRQIQFMKTIQEFIPTP